jgi:hypothetical protein
MRPAWLAGLVAFVGWVAAAEPAREGWGCMGNLRLATTIDQLTGPGAIDCGFHEIGRPLKYSAKRKANDCLRKALRGHKPFKFGTVRVPLDSIVTEVLVRSADGKLWMIVVDEMFDEQPTQWNAICREVRVDTDTLYLDGNESCEEYSGGTLYLP